MKTRANFSVFVVFALFGNRKKAKVWLCPPPFAYANGGGHTIIIMKLLEQILNELGADDLKSFTIVPTFGGYFRSVKTIVSYSAEKTVLLIGKNTVAIEGDNLEVGSYFEQDIFIKGNIKAVKVE